MTAPTQEAKLVEVLRKVDRDPADYTKWRFDVGNAIYEFETSLKAETDRRMHTAGPWRISSLQEWYVIPGNQSEPICSLAEFTDDGEPEHIFPDNNVEQARSNARLIAAAPELLEGAQGVVRFNEDGYEAKEFDEVMARLKAVIRRVVEVSK